MFLDSPEVVNFQGDAVKMLMDYSEIYFGVKIENIPVLLFKHSISLITETFKGLTLLDIENSFKYSKIEKKQYTALTVEELINPIYKYFEKKKILKAEIDKINKLEKEKIDHIMKEKEFKKLAKLKYLKTLKTGVFEMDEFECNSIAVNFKDMFNQDQKNVIWIKAKTEFKKRSENANQFEIIPSAKRIFSRMIIEECIKKGFNYIEE